MKRFILFAGLLAASAINSFATINVTYVNTTGAGPFNWNYDAELNANSQLVGTGALDQNHNGFFTIYDITGYINAIVPNADWNFSAQSSGFTSSGVLVSDDARTNVTFFYTGAGISTVGLGSQGLNAPGTFFTIVSTSNTSRVDNISYRDLNAAGQPADGRSFTEVPGDPRSVVPEPATMSLIGGTLAGLAFVVRRRK